VKRRGLLALVAATAAAIPVASVAAADPPVIMLPPGQAVQVVVPQAVDVAVFAKLEELHDARLSLIDAHLKLIDTHLALLDTRVLPPAA
jgi:hypothetical protein